jgi:hypothetical protein
LEKFRSTEKILGCKLLRKKIMPFTLPPKFDSLRRAITRSHNRRVVIILWPMILFVIIGVVFAKSNNLQIPMTVVFGILILLVLITGFKFVSQLDMKQSVKLGFVCPQCGKGLYCATGDRLWIRGECPHCKQFIIEKLGE